LHHVEAELRFEVSSAVLGVLDGVSVFGAELGILEGNGLIYGWMAGDVGGIVREGAQGEGVLVGILTLQEQLTDEITAANVVNQVAEFHTAEGIVAEVLDDRATIGVTVCLLELVLRERWKSLEKEWAEIRGPHQVHDFLVGEHGIGEGTTGAQEHDKRDSHRADGP